MPFPKSQVVMLLVLVLLIGGGAFYWSHSRETPEKAAANLAAQNIEINEDNFFKEIKAGHAANVHDFLMAGGRPDTMDLNGQGISALMVAADTGNKDIVSMLLSALPRTPDAVKVVNMQDTAHGTTALMIAAEKDDADIASLLLGHGADTQLADKTQETPLIIAVRHSAVHAVPVLIAADAGQRQGISLNTADTSGETPLTYAIRGGNKSLLQALLAAKADAISGDRSGTTPLMIAAQAGNEDAGSALIAAGAKLDVADRSGNSPLTFAIRNGHPGFAKLLIGKGANPDYRTTGPSPLEVAISAQPFDAQLFAYLLQHSKQTANLDASMLFGAIDQKNATLAHALLDHGISAKAVNPRGETLLYHAIENGLQETAVALIDKGADINLSGIAGITPLERATRRNEIKVVQKLLAVGSFPDQKTTEGYTLAEMAVYSGYPEILDALLAKGAKLEKDFGVLWAIRDGGGKAVPVLLKYGAHPNVMSNSGDPALWLAASAGEVEAVAALIQYHAALDYPNTSQSMTPLAAASHGGKLAVVKLLVQAGAKIEMPDEFGMTPLAHAAYMTKPDVVEYLISKGANVHAADKQGRSIADLAALGEASTARDTIITMLQQKK